ncbi:Cd5 [Columba guinea]|nr:Cd5 [Columba guinea]
MGGLCLLWVALAAVAPGQGAVSRGVTATVTPPIRDVTPPYRVPTAPMELTGPPSAAAGNTSVTPAEVSPGTGTLSPQHTLLFVLCLVLAALLLLTVLAFTAALLRVRKRSAHAVSPLGLAVPVLVTHSVQSPDVPSATPNDYREMPPSLPKGPDPAVTAHPTTKDSSSDSDYEHYDFSSKPPVALSTFYIVPRGATLSPGGPPRLWLVDGDIGCSGFVELHRQGLWGAVAATLGVSPALATRLCHAAGCGVAIDGHSHPTPERRSHLPVRWEVAEPCESHSVLDCFNRTSARRRNPPAFIVCSGSRPQALRRLASGPTPCEGDIEVFAEGQWRVLCDNRARRAEWGRQLCRELRCGNLSSSTEIQDPPSMGVTCRVPTLHLCHDKLGVPQTCSRTRVTFSKKKQRQWIGPTGLNQTVSFHRNSTATPRAQGQRVQHGDNDYAQPPQKSSQLSAYPALEGACRTSIPLDNSSDSDYDLHSTRRL